MAAATAVAAGTALLLVRIAPDVGTKPLWIDEAIAGLIGARPLPEVLETVLWDRGGAPLHFVLAHVAFAFDASPEALRWLSVVFALATPVVTFDLGRRLAGPLAGSVSALVVATSSLLWVYGSVGRMYAPLAFVGALSADLFVRALQLRTPGSAYAAAGGAWLLPAVHPYGGIVAAVEAVVGLVVWRGRPLRPALPVALIGLAALPFLVADFRLAQRFSVGTSGEGRVASFGRAWDLLTATLGGFAGEDGLALAFFVALGLAGIAVIATREPAFVAFACLALAAPLVLLVAGRSEETVRLATRHLMFALPLWAALIGVGAARAARELVLPAQLLFVVGLAALAAFAASDRADPRFLPEGRPRNLAEPARRLEEQVQPGDVLFPYSPVFLAALPATRHALTLPREGATLEPALDHVDFPVDSVFVAVPRRGADVAEGEGVESFRAWLLAREQGPFATRESVIAAAARALEEIDAALSGESSRLRAYLDSSKAALCGREPCPAGSG
ncbi:MAG: hypothetical protein ACRDM8_00870 [Gaiellaceae bacterium]